ncbi:ThiJ/PfpI family protein [Talaromyces stipitatus ATCC 10500]|uniref:ThiJ/PfpI family protein n=1 Tax=Talaromyces stipitatus (strain ATCC 10500 / CBS 375.48 / QM 6759 / NRRL 1006) TaxID=441959 RepID=B8MG89_TALSN|nr:ThiJ/PfpI family protein [Talaromyces stipitatus ATCC 10500]EED16209.1 ThiJ/PfpI family protein [Talaromyces stipitatus ATCC 10500]
MSGESPEPPVHWSVVLFPGFQALDVFGPLDILNLVARYKKIELSIIAATLDPVSTDVAPLFPGRQDVWNLAGSKIGQSVVPTHTFDSPPEKIEVLLIPGGGGTRSRPSAEPVVEFIKKIFSSIRYLLTVCTGSGLAARAGVLDGKRATSNKRAWKEVTALRTEPIWVQRARWVAEGNIWSSSGISAGMDMMFAYVEYIWGKEFANTIAKRMEYIRNEDWDNDPFWEVMNE